MARRRPTRYEILSVMDGSPPHVEARRSGMRAAFAAARKIWREYKGSQKIEVRYDGILIADDVSDFYMGRKKYSCEMRGFPV